MSDYGVVAGVGTVRLERVLPGPIELVWEYLTDSKKRGTWFAAGEMELRVGGKVELVFHNADLSPHEEPVPEKFEKYEGYRSGGHITQLDPPRLLAFMWVDPESENEVTFELTPRDGETLLVITHRNLTKREEMLGVSSGWHIHLDILEDVLRGVTPRPFWSTLEKYEKEYEKRM
jgi:uncharacterized protein YndB with AHSA1/START domain